MFGEQVFCFVMGVVGVGNFCLIEEGPQVCGCAQNNQRGFSQYDYGLEQRSGIMGFKSGKNVSLVCASACVLPICS